MRRLAWVLVILGCAPTLRDGRFSKPGVQYRVTEPDAGTWKRMAFAENDLAWVSKETGHVVAMNATCGDHGDPTVEVLTSHLLIGFDQRELRERHSITLDGRGALRSTYDVSIDGVPAEVEVVVLKKNGCVHDFTYVSPKGARARQQPTFDALVHGFMQEAAP